MSRNRFMPLLALPVLWLSGNAFAWPKLPIPNGAVIETIADQMRLNGVPMRLQRAEAEQDIKTLTHYYKREMGSETAVTPFGRGVLLTLPNDQFINTVRLSPMGTGKTEILLSSSDIRSAQAKPYKKPLHWLPSSELLSDMETEDHKASARQLVFINRNSVDTNAQILIKGS